MSTIPKTLHRVAQCAPVFHTFALVAFLVLALLAGAGTALAHDVSWPQRELLQFPNLTAKAEGHQYKRPSAVPAYAWKAELFLSPGHTAGVKSWEIWPELDGSLSLKSFGVAKSYPVGHRPFEVEKTVGRVIYASVLEDFAVEKCTANAQKLKQQGKSDAWIFSREHELTFEVRLELDYDIRIGVDSHLPSAGIGLEHRKITCEAAPPPSREPVDPGPTREPRDNSVESATLITIEQTAANGLCQVTTSGVVTTTLPDTTVKFRYADDDGHQSDVKTVKTDHSRTVFFSHKYDVPNNPQGSESGKIRLLGVSTAFSSAWSNYSMDCGTKAPGGLSTGIPKPGSGKPTGATGRTTESRPGTRHPRRPGNTPQDGSATKKYTDVAATQLRVVTSGRNGSVAGRIANLGTEDSRLRYDLVVRANRGKEVLRKRGALALRAGQHESLAFDFRALPGARYEAVLSVRAVGDTKPENDQRRADTRR